MIKQIGAKLRMFADKIATIQVLDPACGSGNFLYVALRLLLDLQNEVINLSDQLGAGRFFISVSPSQLHGIEINEYAHELAQITIWIGYIQWLVDNGYGLPAEPILKPMQTILQMDAILAHDEAGNAVEPAWPKADVIIGNPPFLGDKKMRAELGDQYVEELRTLYNDRIPGGADLVTYWFEKARANIQSGEAKRAGLLATNSIRSGANREVLERIKSSGDIFMAWSDRSWILDGAAVRVSMVCFDNGTEKARNLDGVQQTAINADLTSHVDVTVAKELPENNGLCFLGMMKAGPFDIDSNTARTMLSAPINPNGRSNSDVIKHRLGGQDVVQVTRDVWIIDFNEMSMQEASCYEAPFEYVKKYVKPLRDVNRDNLLRTKWWLLGRSRPELRSMLTGKNGA